MNFKIGQRIRARIYGSDQDGATVVGPITQINIDGSLVVLDDIYLRDDDRRVLILPGIDEIDIVGEIEVSNWLKEGF